MKNNYKIILIDKKDTNRINKIIDLSDKFYHKGINISHLHIIFVIEINNNIIAFAALSSYYGFWCLRLCVVHPKYRGLGLQKLLIQERIKFLKNKKVKHVNVWIKPENCYSLNNCIDAGFKFTKEKSRLFNGDKHYKLRKILAQ